MNYTTKISVEELYAQIEDPEWVIIDCRFYLTEPDTGYLEYQDAHIPGAAYANLDRDLSGQMIPGKTGRHPLPTREELVDRLSAWGIDQKTQVVAYDSMGGAVAARLWWLLRWLGHDKAAVLDGGWNAWVISGYPVQKQMLPRKRKIFTPVEHQEYIADKEWVEKVRLDPDYLLVDARSAERYWGLKETIDKKAGHIPGAVSAPYIGNLTEDEFFRSADELKERFMNLIGDIPAEKVIFYCGSGVTSIHNIIAMLLAGYGMAKLYPGSWSEWSADPNRPTAP